MKLGTSGTDRCECVDWARYDDPNFGAFLKGDADLLHHVLCDGHGGFRETS